MVYKWQGKLLKVDGKFAAAESCCCGKWYCILTKDGDYECSETKPDDGEVLSEHDDEKACQDECYERYYCIDDGGDYMCVKEGELPEDADIISGPDRLEDCEASCENCPPCGDKACESDFEGNTDAVEECCYGLGEEEWTFRADTNDWELTAHCGGDERSPCEGSDAAGFPQNPSDGDTTSFPCKSNGSTPTGNKDCEKCKYDCVEYPDDPTSSSCERAPDTGKSTQEECERECLGQWYCTSTFECERQKEPANPAKTGYDSEDECVDAAPTDCTAPPPPPTCEFPYNVTITTSITNVRLDPDLQAAAGSKAGEITQRLQEVLSLSPPAFTRWCCGLSGCNLTESWTSWMTFDDVEQGAETRVFGSGADLDGGIVVFTRMWPANGVGYNALSEFQPVPDGDFGPTAVGITYFGFPAGDPTKPLPMTLRNICDGTTSYTITGTNRPAGSLRIDYRYLYEDEDGGTAVAIGQAAGSFYGDTEYTISWDYGGAPTRQALPETENPLP
jgi:hypothetical protein